jgi:hypothetical protein
MTTATPSIPAYDGTNTDQVLASIISTLNVREGYLGDKMDKAITYRELALLGLAQDPTGKVKANSAAATNAGIPVATAVEEDGYDPTLDLTSPPAPPEVILTPSIGLIHIFWNQPSYRNHAYAEIWRAEVANIGAAVKIGTSDSQNYVDAPTNTTAEYYYWVRFVSAADVKGPYNSQLVKAKANIDPAVLIASLENELLNSTLSKNLALSLTNATNQIVEERESRQKDSQNLYAQYTVKIDQNGHVSGFGLASETIDGTTTSAFIVRADKFAIVDPTSTSNSLTTTPAADVVPFQVTGGAVYIKSAMIAAASITSAQIASLAANKITAGYINATIGINGAKVYGAELYAGGSVTVNSDGTFSPVNPTVNISGGNAKFVAGNFSVLNSATGTAYSPFTVSGGDVYINSAFIADGTITNAMIGNTIQSSSYSAGSTGWKIDKSGASEFNSDVTFRGAIDVKSSTSGERLEITNSKIQVYDSGGTLRVKIGDLS